MKRLPCVLILAMLSVSTLAQTQPSAEKGAPRKRVVTLETVLSCSDDSLMNEVFKTDAFTASLQLNFVSMRMTRKEKSDDLSHIALLAKGFLTGAINESSLVITPTDYLGHIIEDSSLPFCRKLLTAHYKELTDRGSGPYMVEIDGEGWALNSNEIFAHADQFQFESGVFTNSSAVFFTAKKGRVSIQFVCKPEGLNFYRALYVPRS